MSITYQTIEVLLILTLCSEYHKSTTSHQDRYILLGVMPLKRHRQCSTLISTSRLALIKQITLQHQFHRSISATPSLHATKKRRPIDESSWANAQHKPSLGNASFGHLIYELSSTKEGMEHLRVEGQTMSEEHRAEARGVVKWLIAVGAVVVGVPVGLGVKKMVWGEGEEVR